MSNLLIQVQIAIREYGLLGQNDSVMVACSGGPDSMALFYVLHELSSEYGLKLFLAHLNHGIRDDTDEDEAFIRKLSEATGINLVCEKVDCLALSKQWRVSLEGAARRARYDFFTHQARTLGISKIALGHTANDQAETILMRLIRGSGLRGMAGIPPVRYTEGLSFIRPLLGCERADILEYIYSRRIPHRMDKTNFKRGCTRNKIRLDIIPYIKKELNPSIIHTLSRTAELLREDHMALDHFVSKIDEQLKVQEEEQEAAIGWKTYLFAKKGVDEGIRVFNSDQLRALPLGVQRQILIKALARFYGAEGAMRIHYKHIRAILRLINGPRGGGEINLPRGVKIYRQGPRLVLTSTHHMLSQALIENNKMKQALGCPVKIPGTTHIPSVDLTLKTQILTWDEKEAIPSDPMIAFMDYETFKKPVQIRTRLPGDRFHPLGTQGEKKLKEFFIDNKVLRRVRDIWPLLTSGSNILWVLGLRIGHPYRVTSRTSKVLKVEFS